MNEPWDKLVDALLREELGRESPPDLTERVLSAAARQRRRALVLAMWPMAAAAGIVIAVALFLFLRAGAYPAPRAVGPVEIVNASKLTRGVSLRTGAQPAQIELGGYCHVRINPQSEVRIGGVERAEEIKLQRGSVLCSVDPLHGGFAVLTDVGLVRVTGTQFEVTVVEEKGDGTMSGKRMFVRVLAGAIVATGAWGSVSIAAGQERALPEKPRATEPAKPTAAASEVTQVTGLLVDKDRNGTWVRVKADGEKEAKQYIPAWHGGNPDQGGGFDKETVEAIKKLRVTNRVAMTTRVDEHPRVLTIQMIVPEEKAGVTTGTVLAREKGWIDIQPDGMKIVERYMARWVSREVGLDPETIAAIEKTKVGDKVRITWTYDERKRVTKLEVLSSAEAPAPERR